MIFPDLRSRGTRWNPTRGRMCSVSQHRAFFIILPLSRYDLSNVERDITHQTIIMMLGDLGLYCPYMLLDYFI